MAEVECDDKHCLYHGDLKVRGQMLIGTVICAGARRTVTVERPRMKYITKYRRYARERSRIHAHNPPCINARIGDTVRIGECRRISRTKS